MLRFEGRHRCAVQLPDTGAVLTLNLGEPVDWSRAGMVSVLMPVRARATLGPLEGAEYTGCTLALEWPRISYPPPRGFKRKKRGDPTRDE